MVDIAVITITTATDHHHIKVETTTASNRAIGSISIDLLHSSTAHHSHLHTASRTIVTTHQWTRATLSHSRDVSQHLVLVVVVVTKSLLLSTATTLASLATLHASVLP